MDHKLKPYIEDIEIRACRRSLLLCSDENAFSIFLERHSELAFPFNAIEKSHIETYLSQIPFLKGVKESQLVVLAAMCRYESLDANEIVFEENSPGDKLYILLNGRATVLAPQWQGNATPIRQSLEWGSDKTLPDERGIVVVADLKNGDYFGETALFVNINRTSTVKTIEKSLFVTVEKRTFENFCSVCPIKEAMEAVMKERMVSKLSSLGIPFLDGIPAESLKSLNELVDIRETSEGEVIFREGDKGDRFYIIVHGDVKVETRNGFDEDKDQDELEEKSVTSTESRHLGILSAGNYFGEMSLVSDSPRSATVTSVSKTILLGVDKESFRIIFASNSNALAEFTLRLLRARAELKHLLAHTLGLSAFRTFLQKSLAEENLDFWISSNEFKSTEALENLDETANEIYEKYCKEGAEKQVNLPHKIRSEIETAITNNAVDKHSFDVASNEIYQLMVRDNYARFKRTQDFELYFKRLGILIESKSGSGSS